MAQAGITYRTGVRCAPGKVPSRRTRAARMNGIMFRLFICLVMVLLFVYIGRMATISSGAKQITQIRRELSDLEEQRQYLEIALSARQNIDRVRDEATARLGMSYPTDVRLVSLNGYVAAADTQTAHDTTMP